MKHIIFFFSMLLLFSCTGKKEENNTATSKHDTLAPPHITILAELPDSLQPKTWALDTMPKPLRVVVPAHSGGSYTINDYRGVVWDKIKLEPLVVKSLPVLRDAKGEAIKDSFGNPFIMGDGGISNFTNFTTDNGLTADVITCSIMDKTGKLWFGTMGAGVSSYDGKAFTTFTIAQGLANNHVGCIAKDNSGNLWFGTDGGGVSCYDGKTFTTFSSAQGLPNYGVWSIAEDKRGKIWFGTEGGGVSCYDGKTFTTFTTAQGLANNYVWGIAEDRTGNLWFCTDSGVSHYDGKTFTTLTTAQGLGDNAVRSVCEDKAGNLWFGTYGGGVSRYDPSASLRTDSKSFTTFTTAQGLACNFVLSIAEDKVGKLWFGTYGGGVSRYDPSASLRKDSKSFVSFSDTQGLANNLVRSICEDKTGKLWFGTEGGGVSRYEGQSFVSFSNAQGLANSLVWSICEDKRGKLWFGTNSGGVSCYDGKTFTAFTMAQGLTFNTVYSIAEDKEGKLWFGTNYGVSCYDGKTFTNFTITQGLAHNVIWGIAEDRTGKLWFCTNGGVSSYNGKTFTTFTAAQGLANNHVRSMAEDKTGKLWFGTEGGGVSCYDGKTFTTFTTAQGLADNTVHSICEDKTGNLWFGTNGGLSVMISEIAACLPAFSEKVTAREVRTFFKTFTETDGLVNNKVLQVMQMPNGKMAVGGLGVTMFSPSADFTTLNDIEIYNSNTGCPIISINGMPHCMLLDSKGKIWVANSNQKNAIVRFDPSALQSNKDTPSLIIKSIKVNEESICWYDIKRAGSGKQRTKADSNVTPAYITEEVTTMDKVLTEKERDSMKRKFSSIEFDGITPFYYIPEHLVLPYRDNRITIDFNAIETGKPNLVNYRYMLEGYDKDWSPVLKNTSATFGNIHEGTYTFKVKAQGPNGVWCGPVSYTFRVLPPIYRTWWAYLIYTIFILLAILRFIKWRERNLRTEKEKLERKVEERTAVVEKQKEELIQKNIIVEKQKADVEQEKRRSDELLLNILPEEVAEELKAKGSIKARHFDHVTVLFTDFVNFTSAAEHMGAQSLIDELHTCFKKFDEITGKYGIEKIKTIGDAYLAVAGLPTADPKHAEHIVRAATEINAFMQDRIDKLGIERTFAVRIGIHTGSVVAGIVGVKKFAYDIWGDTVNTAARMEQNSEPGKVNISETTYDLVKDKFNCTYRGEVDAKGKGKLKMYYALSTEA